jgi:hypothetical protein
MFTLVKLMSIYRCLVQTILLVGLMAMAQGAVADSLTEGQDALMRGDDSGAIRLWTPPATAGDPEAQFRLGMMYLSGRGVAHDKITAMRWLRLALEKHHIGASLTLAKLYLDKTDGSYDPEAAILLLRDVGEKGVIEAQRYLGQIYRNGGGVSQDFSEALHWFKLGASNGDIESQIGLGELYRYGYGVEQSYPRAFMWMSLAASGLTNNSPERIMAAKAAVKARNEIERLMSAEDRAEAERLAITCWQAKLQQCD